MIKAYEGQKVSNAMVDALVAQELERQRRQWEAEQEREKELLRMELDMRRQRDAQVFTHFIEQARRDYPEPARGTLLGGIGWALVGWLVLAFGALFDRLGV